MSKQVTIVAFIVDESGSMASCKSAVISGYNELVSSLKKDYEEHPEHGEYLFTLTKFRSVIRGDNIVTPVKNADIRAVPLMEPGDYNPDGGTPLYDAIYNTIQSIHEKVGEPKPVEPAKAGNALQNLLNKPETPAAPKEEETVYKVLCIIQTDGQENASTHTKDDVKNLIEKLEKQGNWTFTYMGVGLSAMQDGMSLGMAKGNVVAYASAAGASSATPLRSRMASIAGSTMRLRESKSMRVNNFHEDESEVVDKSKWESFKKSLSKKKK